MGFSLKRKVIIVKFVLKRKVSNDDFFLKKQGAEQAYVFSDHFIDVVIPFAGGEEDVAAARKTTRKTARKSAKKNPDEIRANIVEFLRANPRLSRLDLSTALGLTEGNVHHYLDSLKREGAIERVGSDKGGYWKVLI